MQCNGSNSVKWDKEKIMHTVSKGICKNIAQVYAAHIGKIKEAKWMMLSASEKMMQQWKLDSSQIKLHAGHSSIHYWTWWRSRLSLLGQVSFDMMQTWLNAWKETWITWDHVCLLRAGCSEWISGLSFVSRYSAGDLYTSPRHSRDAQIKMTLPLVCM